MSMMATVNGKVAEGRHKYTDTILPAIKQVDARGMTALMHAAHQGRAAVVGLLLRCARQHYEEREGSPDAAQVASTIDIVNASIGMSKSGAMG